ncbi:MAG: histidine phosphatase family protein [Burkholderiaceae bacterium]
MTGVTTLVFIRHGQTDWNLQGRIQGQLDEPLNAEGIAQAQRLRALVAQGQPSVLPAYFDVVYASPLVRAWRTAEPLAAHFGLSLQPAPALAERHFGELQGVCHAEMPLRFPEAARRWESRDPEFRPVGGESLNDFFARVQGCVAQLLSRHVGERVLCFTHGGVLDMVFRIAQGIGLEAPRTWGIPNTGINVITHGPDGYAVKAWAWTGHLEGLSDAPGSD